MTKKVAAYETAKLASTFNSQNCDKNIDCYVAKLDGLVKKFGVETSAHSQLASAQTSLNLNWRKRSLRDLKQKVFVPRKFVTLLTWRN